jgi:hypothetical protein
VSATRVITGVDDRGRPKSEWRPIPGADAEPRYGHMQPAYDATTIQRRKATPEELAAARAREEEPTHLTTVVIGKAPLLVPHDADREAASRQRGGQVNRERVAARTAASYRPKPARPPEEEPPMSLTIEEHEVELTTLDRLALAAAEASRTHQAKEAADTAWDVAREALARAYAEVEDLVEPLPPQPDDDHTHYVLTVPQLDDAVGRRLMPNVEELPTPIGGGPVRSRSGEGQRPGQASARDRRATLVMESMARHGDDMGAVAAELGMKKNAVAQIVKFARRRAGDQA